MKHRFFTTLLVALLGTFALLPSMANAQSQRCFPQTGFCISGSIRTYWESNGGLTVFGYPITAQRAETVESRTLQVQWFERDRLEIQTNGSITAGRLGARLLELQGRPWESFAKEQPAPPTTPECSYFAVTGFNVCLGVRTYWERNGGLERFGYPISGVMGEMIEGKIYSVQYFERRRIEVHPENQPPYDLLLGLLGREVLNLQGGSQPATNPLAGTSWQWVKLTDPTQMVQIQNPASYTISFTDATNVSVKADCNQLVGTYSATNDGALSLAFGPSTLVACPSPSRGDDFTRRLQAAARYFIRDGHLFIDLFADGGTLEFAPPNTTAPQPSGILVGTSWQWTRLTDPTQIVEIQNPANYTITFVDATNVSINADCNQLRGTYRAVSDGTMTITIGTSTRVACPPGSRGDEFTQKLGAVARFTAQNAQLRLELMADGGTLEFVPVPATPSPTISVLSGTSWQWVKLTDPTQMVEIQNPANYTITFVDATNISIKADCNLLRGSYTANDNGSVTITIGPSTRVACPPGSRGDEFTQKLGFVTRYSFQNGQLLLDLMADGGTLIFNRQ